MALHILAYIKQSQPSNKFLDSFVQFHYRRGLFGWNIPMDPVLARGMIRAAYSRLNEDYGTVTQNIQLWMRDHIQPLHKKKTPATIRKMAELYERSVVEKSNAILIHKEDEFRQVGSKMNERAMARSAMVCVSAGETMWYLPREEEKRLSLGNEKNFFMFSYAYVVTKSGFVCYRVHLPWHITVHAVQRFLERGDATSVEQLFDERLLRAVVLFNPLCRAILDENSSARHLAFALPYGNDLMLGVPRRVRPGNPQAIKENVKFTINRNGYARDLLNIEWVVKAHIHTFVHFNQMMEGQDTLVRILNEFYERYKDELWTLFRMEVFRGGATWGDESDLEDRIERQYSLLIDSLVPIINHRVWSANVREPQYNWLTDRHQLVSKTS